MDLRESGFKGKVSMSGCVGTIAEATHGFGNSLRLPPRFPLSFQSSKLTSYPQVKPTYPQVIHKQKSICSGIPEKSVRSTLYLGLWTTDYYYFFIILIIKSSNSRGSDFLWISQVSGDVAISYPVYKYVDEIVDNLFACGKLKLKDIDRKVENLGNGRKGVSIR